jgi:hypothetical protein
MTRARRDRENEASASTSTRASTSILADPASASIKRIAWAFGCSKKDSEEERALYKLLLERTEQLRLARTQAEMLAGGKSINELIEQSSIGEGLRNIRENGIDAELADLEDDLDREECTCARMSSQVRAEQEDVVRGRPCDFCGLVIR